MAEQHLIQNEIIRRFCCPYCAQDFYEFSASDNLRSTAQILMMDEATASVDRDTDARIQRVVRERFAHCTVLTIAHRLHTIMDAERALVMHCGAAVECDSPHALLQARHLPS